MEKVLGIIAEYNPLHNGHIYHIEKSKQLTNSKYVVAVITGNFTQRGEPSLVNKWEKAKNAINSGVDLVIELPTVYSISSAENFAEGAIKVLSSLGFITDISFGIEENDINEIEKIASILEEEPEGFKDKLKQELKKGNSFPKAREKAIVTYLQHNEYGEILSKPNNILAIEYLKALKKYKSKITPIGIKREKANYNSDEIINEFASSTAIRKLFQNNELNKIKEVVPETTYKNLIENIEAKTFTTGLENFNDIINYKLRTMSRNQIKEIPEVEEGLENLIKKSSEKTNNFEELISMIKSKRYTEARIKRILLYSILGITKADMELSKIIIPYIRVLGFNKNGENLLAKINNKEVITSVKSFETKNEDKILRRLLDIDRFATDIYTLAYKKNSKAGLDYTHKLVIK